MTIWYSKLLRRSVNFSFARRLYDSCSYHSCYLLVLREKSMYKNQIIRVVTIQMDLAIPKDDCECVSKEDIINYLNKKLYEDPEFFGDFGPENIVKIDYIED